MPKSLNEIKTHAESLQKQIDEFDPRTAIEIDVVDFELRCAAVNRANCEREVADAVVRSRLAGYSWSRIGASLGISAQAAHQRYSKYKVKKLLTTK